jgi:hypothetical protein
MSSESRSFTGSWTLRNRPVWVMCHGSSAGYTTVYPSNNRIRRGYPDNEPWAVKAIRITALTG